MKMKTIFTIIDIMRILPRVVDEEKCKSNFMLLPCGESRTLILPFLISITIWHTEGHAVCLEIALIICE